jgi:integrase
MQADILSLAGEDMARRRWQNGHLEQAGGRWRLRYREDYITPDGSLERRLAPRIDLGPAAGPGKMTKRQAEAQAAAAMLEINAGGRQPQSVLSLADYVEQRFKPSRYPDLKPRTRIHYDYMLRRHVLPALGPLPLRDIKPRHVSDLLLAKSRDFGRQTCTHIRNVIHAIFEHAAVIGFWDGARNPAQSVRAPRAAREPRKITGYTVAEAQRILALLETPLREMAMLGIMTSMGAAELAGLRVGRLNLSDRPAAVDGRPVPPWSLVVAENRVDNQYVSTKNDYRYRTLPVPSPLRGDLQRLVAGKRPDDPVFSLRGGRPVDTHNVTNRTFRKISRAIGIPVNWHRLRYTHATWTAEMMFDDNDRQALMEHNSSRMTAHYTGQTERMRTVAEALASRLIGGTGGIQ